MNYSKLKHMVFFYCLPTCLTIVLVTCYKLKYRAIVVLMQTCTYNLYSIHYTTPELVRFLLIIFKNNNDINTMILCAI